jgi:hypothetical protein
MNRRQLEHVLRASGSVAASATLVVVGSQAILGPFPDAPDEVVKSMEVDLYPMDRPERSDLIDGSIGEMSPFHETFGYYAHGVAPDTATLPAGWRNRLIKVENENTGGVAGLCISPVDLAISKLLAGREKDLEFVGALLKHRLVAAEPVVEVMKELPESHAALASQRLSRLVRGE